MPYSFVADIFFTQRNFVTDFLQAECYFTRKTAGFAILSLPWGLRDNARWLIGKRVVNFLLVLIELFARCYG